MRDCMTIKTNSAPGKCFMSKVLMYFQQKSNPILFDANINSEATIAQNIYNICNYGAVKFVVHAKALSQQMDKNPAFFVGTWTLVAWL